MVKPEQVSWGRYQAYEGPLHWGMKRYVLPANPTNAQKRLKVLSATEGCLDGVNMYDSCVLSVGAIQFCERFYLVSQLFGDVANKLGQDKVLKPLAPALSASKATFKQNSRGQWRFFFLDDRGEVNSLGKQHELFLHCDGKVGSWTQEARSHAKLWAACASNVFIDDDACNVQVEFIIRRLNSFTLPESRKLLFNDSGDDANVTEMLRAAFTSFAANNPMHANNSVKSAVVKLKSPRWSLDWCIGIIKEMTFGPNVGIYPKRYEHIRPHLEKLWNVSLPKTAKDLKAWQEPLHERPTVQPPRPSLTSVPDVEAKPEPTVVELPEVTVTPTAPPIVISERVPAPKQGPIAWLINLIVSLFGGKR